MHLFLTFFESELKQISLYPASSHFYSISISPTLILNFTSSFRGNQGNQFNKLIGTRKKARLKTEFNTGDIQSNSCQIQPRFKFLSSLYPTVENNFGCRTNKFFTLYCITLSSRNRYTKMTFFCNNKIPRISISSFLLLSFLILGLFHPAWTKYHLCTRSMEKALKKCNYSRNYCAYEVKQIPRGSLAMKTCREKHKLGAKCSHDKECQSSNCFGRHCILQRNESEM